MLKALLTAGLVVAAFGISADGVITAARRVT